MWSIRQIVEQGEDREALQREELRSAVLANVQRGATVKSARRDAQRGRESGNLPDVLGLGASLVEGAEGTVLDDQRKLRRRPQKASLPSGVSKVKMPRAG